MPNLKYLFARIANMDTRAMLEKTAIVQQRTGRNRLLILADMIVCGFKYEAGYMDYVVLRCIISRRKSVPPISPGPEQPLGATPQQSRQLAPGGR